MTALRNAWSVRLCALPVLLGVQDPCLQVLSTHSSSVTCVTRGTATGTLLSSSTDGTVIVWAPVAGRELALYPWFHPAQVLHFGKL